MNKLLINLVSTNAGWLARQAVKYSAVGAAVITGWLIGKGLDATHAAVVGAGVTSAVLGCIEAALSWVARRYSVPELNSINESIEAAKKASPLVVAGFFALSLTSCASVMAWAASPLGQATVATATTLGKQLAKAAEQQVVAQIIVKASTSLSALEAQGVNADTAKEIVRQSEMAGLQAVIETAQQQYLGMTGSRYVIPTASGK